LRLTELQLLKLEKEVLGGVYKQNSQHDAESKKSWMNGCRAPELQGIRERSLQSSTEAWSKANDI